VPTCSRVMHMSVSFLNSFFYPTSKFCLLLRIRAPGWLLGLPLGTGSVKEFLALALILLLIFARRCWDFLASCISATSRWPAQSSSLALISSAAVFSAPSGRGSRSGPLMIWLASRSCSGISRPVRAERAALI
jgi:hypothetical protein